MKAKLTSDQGRFNCQDSLADGSRDLKTASRPLVEYIRKNYTPMTTAIVTGAGVELVNTEMSVPFKENWD